MMSTAELDSAFVTMNKHLDRPSLAKWAAKNHYFSVEHIALLSAHACHPLVRAQYFMLLTHAFANYIRSPRRLRHLFAFGR